MNLIKEELFRSVHRGKPVELYTLKNKNGLAVQVTNFGAKIVSLYVNDKMGKFVDIVLGYDSIEGYITGNPYFGAICGRYANRIAKGRFTINGTEYRLPLNNGSSSLHGGPDGFNNQVFDAKPLNSQSVAMTYQSCDGEMGYPGNLSLKITYSLNDQNELNISYNATTDKPTHINICSHSFFNLAGEGNGKILDHELTINASRFTPVTDQMIPTGELNPVTNTPMDFMKPFKIGERIADNFEQLEIGKGYDHNWVLSKDSGVLSLAAICYEPISGRVMKVYTTQPGLQLYTGNWLDGSDIGKDGKTYGMRSALCLETQHFPDSPNQPLFPSTLLKPGEVYKESCIYKFTTR
jgi:aldose 1-epimerase